MILVAGLGNPGNKYKYSRHNVGFMVVERLAKDLLPLFRSLRAWKQDDRFKSEICKVSDSLLLVKPQTFMNNSGIGISLVRNYFKIKTTDIWIVYDDIDLPLGKIRIKKEGGSAGHNGIRSAMQLLGQNDFVRIRLGIGRGMKDPKKTSKKNISRSLVEKFVLSPFMDSEAGDAKKLVKHASEAIRTCLKDGIETAMNRFN